MYRFSFLHVTIEVSSVATSVGFKFCHILIVGISHLFLDGGRLVFLVVLLLQRRNILNAIHLSDGSRSRDV